MSVLQKPSEDGRQRLSVAYAAEVDSAAFDGAAVLLWLAGRRDMAADQSSSDDGDARG